MRIARRVRTATQLLRRAVQARRAATEVRALTAAAASSDPDFRIAVYFADGDVNMYQIRQWYRPLAELAKTWPVVVLSRTATGARAMLTDGEIPVAFVPAVRDLEAWVARHDIRVVLYVNQNTRNFQMFRYGHRWHVFINHGESDKMYMTTNQFKAYDFAFVAGQAARDRLGRVLWDYDIDDRTYEIGRPQADHFSGELPYTPDERTVVLYAPTWEGDRPSAHYGSIASHGETLVSALLATGTHRVIYRPHPRSGVVDASYAAAHRRIVAALRDANAADAGAQHVFDDGPELGWQLAAADLAIVDISAMVYDRLATGAPLMVTRPADDRAVVDEHGYLSACEWLSASDAARIVELGADVIGDPDAVARRAHWAERYFGDTSPGAASERFHAAVADLMHRWDEWHDRPAAEDDVDDAEELDPDAE